MLLPLATPSELDAYLSGQAPALLAQATDIVRAYCGWHIAPSTEATVTVDPSSCDVTLLPTLMLTAVGAIADADGQPVTFTAANWRTNGVLRGLGFLPLTVTFTHGYAEVPRDVQSVVLAVAARAQVSPDGVTRRQTGAVSEAYSQTGSNVAGGSSLMEHEKAMLDKYRLAPRP